MNAAHDAAARQPASPAARAGVLSEQARELLGLLAYIYLENDLPEKSAVVLAALDAVGQADGRALASLALAQLRSGKPETALRNLDRVALSGRVDAAFHLMRAQALWALERREESAAAMRAYVSARAQQPAPATPTP